MHPYIEVTFWALLHWALPFLAAVGVIGFVTLMVITAHELQKEHES